jgi:hypothetical protein
LNYQIRNDWKQKIQKASELLVKVVEAEIPYRMFYIILNYHKWNGIRQNIIKANELFEKSFLNRKLRFNVSISNELRERNRIWSKLWKKPVNYIKEHLNYRMLGQYLLKLWIMKMEWVFKKVSQKQYIYMKKQIKSSNRCDPSFKLILWRWKTCSTKLFKIKLALWKGSSIRKPWCSYCFRFEFSQRREVLFQANKL